MTNAVYPSPEENDRLQQWWTRMFTEQRDPFAWCQRSPKLVEQRFLQKVVALRDDQPTETPFTIQDAFELMEKGLR